MIRIIERIKQIIKKIFKKEEIFLKSKETEYEKDFKNTINNMDNQKEEFFELYKNVKNGTVKLDNLIINDLIKIQLIMQQENKFLDSKICENKKQIEELDEKIYSLQKKTKS